LADDAAARTEAKARSLAGLPPPVETASYDLVTKKWHKDGGAEDGGSAGRASSQARRCAVVVQYADEYRGRCVRCRGTIRHGQLRLAYPAERPCPPSGSGKLCSALLHLSCCAEEPAVLPRLTEDQVLGLRGLSPLELREVRFALRLGRGAAQVDTRAMARAVLGPQKMETLQGLHASPVFEALSEWREGAAARSRLAPCHVMSDKALLHLAHVAPQTPVELRAVKVLSDLKFRLHQDGILQAVRKGRERKAAMAVERAQDDGAPQLKTVAAMAASKPVDDGMDMFG